MSAASQFQPLRNIQDIEELERVPLEQRLLSWDVNDWIRHGCDLAPQKVAIRYVEDGNPESSAVTVTYRELKQRATAAANLFHSLGVGPDDAVLYLLPTTPHLYTVMLGSLAAGVSCCINWMLEPEHWAALIKSSRAKVVVALGPTPGYEIWEKLQAIRGDIPAGVTVLSAQALGGPALPGSDFDLLASKQPGDALTFMRKAKRSDIAAYVHSGGTTG
jgi:fatty-acyl-CoA synthase